jgi:chorismate mutase/prephenate dehydratase
MPEPIDALRDRVREIDRRIVDLLSERMATALEIGRAKMRLGIPIEDPEREQQVLSFVLELPHAPIEREHLIALYRQIIAMHREAQVRLFQRTHGETP